MPCYSPTGDDLADLNRQVDERKLQQMKKELDKTTRLLCYVLGQLESKHNLNISDAELKEWWKEHKKYDEKNISLDQVEL